VKRESRITFQKLQVGVVILSLSKKDAKNFLQGISEYEDNQK